MKLTFLGTSDAIPTKDRNHNSIFLNYDSENILVDCGEGTQRQLKKADINSNKITRILITHWHGDHVLGLPGLLQSFSLSGYNKILYIYGPKGFKKKFSKMMDVFSFQKNYEIVVKEVKGKFFENDDFVLSALSVEHGTNCNAYSFVEKDKRRVDKNKLKEFKIKEGPHVGRLVEGKAISYNGKKYSSKKLTYIEKGRKISFLFDAKFSSKISKFVKDSDILISEATFISEDKEMAKEKKHLTAEQAGEIAKKSKSKKLILTHISQRYSKNVDVVLKDAKKVFKNSYLVKDLDVLVI